MIRFFRTRAVLRGLARYGVLVSYTAGMYTGQRLRVKREDGLPVNMSLGTARAYLRRLEQREWGFA